MLARGRHRFVALVLIAGGAALLGTTLIPAINHVVGPAEVTIGTSFGAGRTVLVVAPLGTVVAATHSPPLGVDVSLSELDLQEFARGLPENNQEEIVAEIEDGLRAATIQLWIRQFLGGALIGLLVTALVAGRKPSYLATGAASGALFVTAALLIASFTFDLGEFDEAHYTGALEYAPQVLDAVNRSPEALKDLNSRFATAANRLQELMRLVAEPLPDPNEGTTAILHVSDIHSNPLGVQITRRLATDFGVDAVVDTGDLTSFGQTIEARIGRLLERFPVPYIFVPGNHDSAFNREQVGDIEGVVLLDEDTFRVDDLEILGWADPTFTATNETSTEEGNELRQAEAPRVAAAVENEEPDVLATHDSRLAEDSFGSVPLVLSGHTHEGSREEVEGTISLTVGSTGATGLGSFIVESDRPYEAEIVYFRGDVPVAVDYLSLSGLGGDFEVERRTLDDAEEVAPAPTD